MPRPGSPPTRSSILITSAPRSPRIAEQTGPCCQIVQSSTRTPSSGIGIFVPPWSGNLVRHQYGAGNRSTAVADEADRSTCDLSLATVAAELLHHLEHVAHAVAAPL